MKFQLKADFQPTGDQPEAIKKLNQAVNQGKKNQLVKNIYTKNCKTTSFPGDSGFEVLSGGLINLPVFDKLQKQ